jgi:hypothetical protein
MIKITSDIPGRIKVAFSYNPEYVARIKTVKAHRWHPEGKYWSFPYAKPVLMEILAAFAGEDLDIDPSLQMLISQNQTEKSGERNHCRLDGRKQKKALIPLATTCFSIGSAI